MNRTVLYSAIVLALFGFNINAKQELVESHNGDIAEIFNSVKSREDILELSNFVENMPNNLGEDPFPLFHSFAN